MARVIIDNLTEEQARTFIAWYDGQGEQDADIWFDCHDVPTPWISDISMKVET